MINYSGVMSPNNHMERSWGMIVVAAVGATVSLVNASKNRQEAQKKDAEMSRLAAIEQKKLDAQKAKYSAMTFENPFANMENTYEDLTVNKQQAQFQAQQGSQQRANIMQGLRGAAGGSGIAGLAQSLANQGQIQTQRISASIGLQESQNQKLAAQGAANIQISERQGSKWVKEQEASRQTALLGMQYGASSGANLASQQAQTNMMQANIAQQQATTDMIGIGAQAAGGLTDDMKENEWGLY